MNDTKQTIGITSDNTPIGPNGNEGGECCGKGNCGDKTAKSCAPSCGCGCKKSACCCIGKIIFAIALIALGAALHAYFG